MQRKLAQALGLERVLKDAKPIDLQTYVLQRYGAKP
jgi:hypothetical protein